MSDLWVNKIIKHKGGEMAKIKWVFVVSLVVALMAMPLLAACPGEEETTPTTAPPTGPPTTPPPSEVTLYVGGLFALTGAYAEDMAAILSGYEDYIQYVNETKQLAPWYPDVKIPDNINFEVLWRDDELKPEKALTLYEELKDKGLLVERVSGSPQALALMDLLNEDRIGATTSAVGPYLLSPPKTIFIPYPIYTDATAAIADWFMDNWEGADAPRVAILTADNAMGRSLVIPEYRAYLESAGFEYVGEQYVALVPTSPPTTQLLWLKDNKVDLALGVMINPGAQPTYKEMVRLDMGPDKSYKIAFGTASPGHAVVFAEALGETGDGYLCAGSYPPLDDLSVPGIQFCNDLQDAYRTDRVTHIMYAHGIAEAMTQVEALRLALINTGKAPDELTPVDVLEYGFYMITDLDTGGITSTPLTYGPGDVIGMDEVLVQQVQGGKVVKLGTWPLHNIYKHE
jgi:ABC-type branched-subunit amino acid transport system substrate-binding protein